MQALYIGFARKDTFLTLTLAEGLKASQEALEASGGSSDPEIAAVESLGKKLFERTVKRGSTGSKWSPDESDESRENVKPSQIYERDDYVQTIALKVKATSELKASLEKQSIEKIVQKGSWKITYLGNTNTSTPLGNSTGIAKGETITEMFASGEFNLGDLKDKDGDTIKLQFKSDPLPEEKNVDTTSTSRYQIEFRVNFEINPTSGIDPIKAKQSFICTGIVKGFYDYTS
jgi:hypothetical protein